MTMGPGGQGTRVGAANFGIGIDLAQFEKDLDRAEQLARSRATRIQAGLGSVPIAPLPGAAPRGPGATAAGGNGHRANVPAYVQTLYDGAIAQGMSDGDAKRSIARALGMRVGDLAGLGGGPTATPEAAVESIARAAAPQQRRIQAQVDRAVNGNQRQRASGGRVGAAGGRIFGGLLAETPGTTVRAAGALIGVGLGLSAVVGVASQLHQIIAATVQSTLELADASRQVGVAFGSTAGQFGGAGAAAFANNPLTAGTQTQYLSAIASLGPLANQFSLTTRQVQDLVLAEGQLARIHGVELPQAGQILQQVLRGNLDAGHALDLQLTDEYGVIRGLGLTWQELVQAQGPAAATATLLARVQADVDRQLQSNRANANDTAKAMDILGKRTDELKTHLAALAATPVNIAVNFAIGATGPKPGQALEDWLRERLNAALTVAPQQTTPTPGGRAVGTFQLPPEVAAGLPALPPRAVPPNEQGVTAAVNSQFARDQAAQAAAAQAQRDQQSDAARRAQDRARVQQTAAEATIARINAEADLRRLSVQGQLNDLAKDRIQTEQQLAPLLLEQQRIQDRITLATRENLDLREQSLRAQLGAAGPNAVAQDLSYAQQRIRLLAQVQQSRAIRGLGPAPGVADVPELFRQAQDLALQAPDVQLKALDAQHRVDQTQRQIQADQASKQLSAIPDQKRAQEIQPQIVGLQEGQAANDAMARGIQAILDYANVAASPVLIKAEQDRAAALIAQADAAGKIAKIQAESGGFSLNAAVGVTIDGISSLPALVDQVLSSLRPQLIASINDAINNPRPPSGPPGDRGGR